MADNIMVSRQAIDQILGKMHKGKVARSVFLLEGHLYSCPAGGQMEHRYSQRMDAILLGTYDDECTFRMLVEDLSAVPGVAVG